MILFLEQQRIHWDLYGGHSTSSAYNNKQVSNVPFNKGTHIIIDMLKLSVRRRFLYVVGVCILLGQYVFSRERPWDRRLCTAVFYFRGKENERLIFSAII